MADKYGYEPITSAPVLTAEEIARRNIARSRQEAARKEEAEKRRLALIAEAKRQAAQKKRPAPDENEDRPRSRPSTFSTVPDAITESDIPPKTVKVDDVEMPLDEAVAKIPEQMDFEEFVRQPSPLTERALARARTEELTAGGMAPEKAAEQARQEREKRQAAFERGREAVRKEPATADKEGRGFAESVTSGVGAPIARMLGFGQTANEAEARAAGVQAELSQFRDERYAHPQIAGAVAGAAQNMAQMGLGIAASMLGGPAVGMAVMSGQFGSQEYSRAAYEGAEAGLAGSELNRYALIQGGIEASIMLIMSKIPGMAGIEGRVLRQSVARGVAAHLTIRKALSGAGTLAKDTAAEVTEEVITEVLHGFASEGMLNEDVDYKAVIGDTVLQTLVLMGMTEGVSQAGRLMDAGRKSQPELTQPDPQTQQYETPVLKNPAIDAFIANPGSAKLYEAAVASGMAPLPNPNRTERRKYAAGLKQLSQDPAPQPELQNEASSAAMPPVETPSGMVPDSELDEMFNVFEGSSNDQEANVTEDKPNITNDRVSQEGRQEREQGRQEGLLVPQETAQETPSGTEGMAAAASPNDSTVPAASTREDFEKEYRDTFREWMKYPPDQAGHTVYRDKMADLYDAHPDWADEIENTLPKPEPQAEPTPVQPMPPELASGETSPDQSAPSLADPVSKLPWEMTREEFDDVSENEPKRLAMDGADIIANIDWIKANKPKGVSLKDAIPDDDTRPLFVAQAIRTGKTVPPDVLSEYPYLKPPQPQEATPVATGVPSPDQSSKEAGPVSKPSVPSFLALPQKSQDLFNKAFESKDVESLKQMVAKNNVAWNKEFESRTGIKLPRSLKDRHQAVLDWTAPLAKPEPPAVSGKRSDLPMWGVYPTLFQGKPKFAVKESDKGFGDALFDSEAEAKEYADTGRQRAAERAEREAKNQAAEEAAQKKQQEHEASFQGFLTDDPKTKGKRLKTLDSALNYKNKPTTRKTLVEQKVADGWTVNDKNQLQAPTGEFLDERDLTKTGIDYARHLVNKKRDSGRDKILAAVKQVNPRVQSGDMVSIADLREAVGMEPAEFDKTMQELVKDKVLAAHRFDRPGMVSDEQRQQMLKLGDAYHNTVSLWENEPGDRERINQMMDDAESATKTAAPEAPATAPESMADKAKRLTALTAGTRGDGAVVNVPVTKRGKVETPVMDSIPAMTTNQRKRLQKQRAEQAPVEQTPKPTEESLRREWQRLDNQVVFEEGGLSSLRSGRDVRGKVTEEKTAKWRAEVAVKEREVSELKARAKAAQKAYLDARAKQTKPPVQAFAALPQPSQDIFNKAFESKDPELLKAMVDKNNLAWNKEFENRTGIKLPRTTYGDRDAVLNWAAQVEQPDIAMTTPEAAPAAVTATEPEKQIDRPLVATTRAEWDREIKTRLRSIMSDVDYDNADIERDEGLDAISRAIGFLDENNRTYDKGALSRFENQAVTDMPEDGLLPEPSSEPLPWRNSAVEDEAKWFGTEVSVAPSNRREQAYKGTVVRILNQGEMVEVQPDGQEGTFRVSSDRITIRKLAKSEPEQAETSKPIEQPAIPEFKRTTPDKSSITRQDRADKISEVRTKIGEVEKRLNAKQKEYDGLRSNATKKRADAKREIGNLRDRRNDLEVSIRRDQDQLRLAVLEDAMESPRSYDHYLAGMAAINKIDDEYDDAKKRDAKKFGDELFARAVNEGKSQGLNEFDADKAASSAVNGFTADDDRPLSYFVERAADRIREERMAMPMGKLFPNQSVYRGEKTTLSNEQRDQFAQQLREASKDDQNATAKISAINKQIDKAVQDIKDKAAADAKKKADAASEEKSIKEQEELKNARERSKRYFQNERITKALKAKKNKPKQVFVRKETDGGGVKIVEGLRTDGDKSGDLYANGLILHPEFADDSKDFVLTHKASGLAFPYVAKKTDMQALVSLIDVLGIDFNVEMDADGKLPSDVRERIQKVNTAWANDDYSALSEQDRAIVEKLAEVASTDIQADLILTADDLGANGIPPGMDKAMTDRGVKIIRDMAKDVPEFAYDPVFTFQGGKLVFRDGYTFKLNPQAFNVHPSELKEGQTVGINLEDLGISRATPQDVVAAMLKNAGLPKVLKSKSGRDVTAGYIGSTPASVQQGKEDNEWDVVSGTREVRKIVIDTLSKIRWRQPGQPGEPSTEINGDPAVSPESKVNKEQQPAETSAKAVDEPAATPEPATEPAGELRQAADKARQELQEIQSLNAQHDKVILKEWQRIVGGERPATFLPITNEMARAIVGRMIGSVRAGVKQFEVFIRELRASHPEELVRSIKPNLIRTWNALKDKYDLDDAMEVAFEAAVTDTKDVDIEQAIEAAKGETPEEIPAEPATDQQPTSKIPATDPDDEPTIGIKKAKRAERLQELGLEQEDIVNKIGHSFPELDADAKMVSPGEAEDVFTRIGEGAEAADNASDRDVFVMLNHYAKKQMATRQTQDELEAARESGDDFKVAELEAKLSVQVAEEVRLMAIAKSAGTASGRALAAFKALLKYDFSLARLRLRLDAAADGKPTEAQTREQMELHAKYEAALKELEAKTKEAEEATARAEIAEQIARDMEAKSSTGKTKADKRLEAAWKPFRKADTFFLVTGAFQMLPEFIELAGAHIEKGVETFSEFIDKLSKHFGRQPKPETVPVLQQAWDVAWDNEKNPKPLGPPKVSIEPDHPESLVGAAKALFRFFLSQGITDTDAVIDAVHEELQNQFPDEIGERLDTMKAMVDYDKTRTLSQDPLDILAADKRAIVQLKAKIEDMKRGIAPRRFEQRYPVSDEQRAHIKMFNEEKRKGGFVVTDPDRQAKTALASLETRLRHSISDTLNEIASGARTVSEKTAAPTSDTIEDLQAYLALVRGMHKSIFGDRTMTQEQRLKAAEAAAVKNEAYWNDRLSRAKAGDFSTGKTKPTPVTNATIDAIKARSELAKAQVQELKELANPKPDPEAISDARYLTSLEKQLAVKLARIADIMARAAAGDFAPERNVSKEKREANAQRRKSDANIRDARIKLDEATKALNEQIEQVKKKNLTYVDLAKRVPGAAWALLRDTKLTGELSFILKQGGPHVFGTLVPAGKLARAGYELMTGNPDAASVKLRQARQGYGNLGRTLAHTLKAALWKTDTELARSQDALKQRPNYKNGTYEAMRIPVDAHGGKFSVAEELLLNNLVELGGLALDKRFPGFKGFRDGHPVFTKTAHNLNIANRFINATQVFMAEIRADMADDAAALWTMKSGEMTPAEARSLGNVVNAFTGKGDMSLIGMDNEKARNFLSKLLISAPWLMSRLQMVSGHPFWGKGRTRESQKEAAEMYVDMAAGVAAYYGAFALAAMFMDDDDDERPVVEWDSRSTDYAKPRFGKTRLDPLFGLQQVIVLASRIYHGEVKNSRGIVEPRKGFKDDWALIARFQEGRLHPAIQDIRSLKTGEDFFGQPITKTQVAMRSLFPVTYPDIAEASEKRGIPASIAMGIWAIAGGGLSTYDARTKERADLAAELSIVQRKLKNSNTPADVRKSLQADADAMIESHLVNAVRSEATNNGDTALVDQAASYKPGTTMSPELTEAIQKEKGDLVLRAAELLSTEDKDKKKKSPDDDKSIMTARELLKAVAPTYADADKLYTEAYKRDNESVAELVGPKGKKRYAPKKNVVAARRRLKAMYDK